jgi:hypothetical protein
MSDLIESRISEIRTVVARMREIGRDPAMVRSDVLLLFAIDIEKALSAPLDPSGAPSETPEQQFDYGPDGSIYAKFVARSPDREAGSGTDTRWPPRDVVQRLVDAAWHLAYDHNCDQHGYETLIDARQAAERWLASSHPVPSEGGGE